MEKKLAYTRYQGDQVAKKLKFLFISSDKFPPFRVDVSILFGKEFVNRGHRIDFLLQSDKDCRFFFQTNYKSVRNLVGPTHNGTSFVHRFFKHYLSLRNDLRAIRLTQTEQYDFIQVKDKFIIALIALFLSKIYNTKFFFWLSYPFPEADFYEYKTGTARYPLLYFIRGAFFKFFLYKLILPNCDHIFVQSDQMKMDIVGYEISSDKITPVPMGIDLDDNQLGTKAQNWLEKDTKALIYLGTMQKVRRIDFVIKVFRKVLDKIPDAKLYMVGDSENSEDLELLKMEAQRLKVDHATIFTGNLPRNEAIEYVKIASVGISPFFPTPILNSTSPTKLIEYMALGIPVVANDHPEQYKIIKESKAGYCVPYNENAFAAAIIVLLGDRDKQKDMGQKGAIYVKNYRCYKIIADKLENQYNHLLNLT